MRRALALLALGCVVAHAPSISAQSAVFANAAIATDSVVASAAGRVILEQGGNAADAAVAAALVLGVVQPFASGIGGGGFAIWRGNDGDVVALDFRETAPAAAYRDMFAPDADGAAASSTHGGLAIAVPGEVAGLFALHERYGRLPWSDVVEPARALATDGFEVGELLVVRLAAETDFAQGPRMFDHAAGPSAVIAWPRLLAEFSIDNRTPEVGDLLVRNGLGEALQRIADNGADGFYAGDVADDIVDAARASGGILTLDDLADYAPRWLEPVEIDYRGYTVHAMPLPSSGGLTLAAALRSLEAFALDRLDWTSLAYAHAVIQALSHAFAARATLLGDGVDPAAVADAMLSDARTDSVLETFDPVRTLAPEAYGDLVAPIEDDGTSHLSVIDADGNCVALTTTINTSFGSHVVSDRFGIVLNNQMDDFAARPGQPNAFGLVQSEFNAIAPHRRPLSSMTPSIVERDNQLVGTLGGSGGPMIISATLQVLLALIEQNAGVDEAVARPRLHQQWLPAMVRTDAPADSTWLRLLPEYGYEVRNDSFVSAVQVIWRVDGGWSAASDPRKQGAPDGF